MEMKIFRLYSKNAVVLLSGKNKIEGVTQFEQKTLFLSSLFQVRQCRNVSGHFFVWQKRKRSSDGHAIYPRAGC